LKGVDLIRLWKDRDTGACGFGSKDLVIQYTTDSDPMPWRWKPIPGHASRSCTPDRSAS
jgi:hypothetical protein